VRDLVKMVVVLLVICTISGVALAYVHHITEEPRQYSYVKFVQEPSMKALLSGYENDPIKDRIQLALGEDERGKPINKIVLPAKKDGKIFELAYGASAMGYIDVIEVMVGFKPDGEVIGISIMRNIETPGLGSRISEPEFAEQFTGIDLETNQLSAEGGKIDAISGATNSSIGVIKAVAVALQQFPQIQKEVFKP
jgi:electron transport complex protein RnfG